MFNLTIMFQFKPLLFDIKLSLIKCPAGSEVTTVLDEGSPWVARVIENMLDTMLMLSRSTKWNSS